MHLCPAEYIIHAFGGVRKTARAIGRTPSAISKWRKYKDRNGKIGGIPRCTHDKILAVARKTGIDITTEDLINGRNTKE